MQRNIKDPNRLVTKHLHIFSTGDWVVTADPGIASHFWHGFLFFGLKNRFAPKCSLDECLGRFQQLLITSLKQKDHIVKRPGHTDLLCKLSARDIEACVNAVAKYPDQKFFISNQWKKVWPTIDNYPVSFKKNLLFCKKHTAALTIISLGLFYAKHLYS